MSSDHVSLAPENLEVKSQKYLIQEIQKEQLFNHTNLTNNARMSRGSQIPICKTVSTHYKSPLTYLI